ncbi:MAG: hypothetical protein K0S65_6345, partial [Labilithrix sp.]|nr:hypothetical protein [Labilithrix sp.]
WELAWRRRRQDPELGDGLFARAARSPRTATRAMELLAFLGDLRRIGALDHVEPSDRVRADAATVAKTKAAHHDSPHACRRTAASLMDQVEAARKGRVDPDVTAMPHADPAYVDIARRVLLDDATDDASRDVARDIVLQCADHNIIDWTRLLERVLHERADVGTVRRILEEKTVRWLPARIVVAAWQLEETRDAVVRTFDVQRDVTWSARVCAAEREAQARGLSVEGLLERVALSLAATTAREDVLEVVTLDQLRSVLSALVREAAPADLARVYKQLDDTLSIAAFAQAVRREPLTRRAEFREAARKLDLSSDREKALEAWLELTRPKKPADTVRNDRSVC